MKILKYTPALQSAVKSKTEAKPWLHIAIKKSGEYAIYIWDTRAVVDEGKASKPEDIKGSRALDNRKPLKGTKGEWLMPTSRAPRPRKIDDAVAFIMSFTANDGMVLPTVADAKAYLTYINKNAESPEMYGVMWMNGLEPGEYTNSDRLYGEKPIGGWISGTDYDLDRLEKNGWPKDSELKSSFKLTDHVLISTEEDADFAIVHKADRVTVRNEWNERWPGSVKVSRFKRFNPKEYTTVHDWDADIYRYDLPKP